jgi:hypothetical protein
VICQNVQVVVLDDGGLGDDLIAERVGVDVDRCGFQEGPARLAQQPAAALTMRATTTSVAIASVLRLKASAPGTRPHAPRQP